MSKRTKVMLVGTAAVVVAALTVSLGFGALAKNTEASDFTATTLTGKRFALQDLRGRVVLLNFWATWCPPCRTEAPELEKLWRRYRDQGLVIVGIALNSGADKDIAQFAADNKLTYWLVNDAKGAIARQYRISPIPTTYIIAPTGAIKQVHIGFAPGMEKDLEREIKALLPPPEQLQKMRPLQ